MRNRLIAILLGIFIVILPLSEGRGIFNGFDTIFYTLFVCSIVLIYLLIRNLFGGKSKHIVLRTSDLILATGTLYLLLHTLFVTRLDSLDPIQFWQWIAILLVYVWSRQINNPVFPLGALVLSGVFQSVLALLQFYELLESNHPLFSTTGSFGNPGPLGGYLAVCLIAAAGLARRFFKKRVLRTVFLLGAFVILLGLLSTDSRAAGLAGLIGLAVVFGDVVIRVWKKHKKVVLPLFIACFLFGGYLMYTYRPASADARLLIWKISAGMILEKPFEGHGAEAFRKEYMLHQAEYFENNPDSHFLPVADEVGYPYNEFLHVWIEYGVLGVLIVFGLFISVLFSFQQNDSPQTSKAAFTGLIIFSLFSYPSYIFPLLLLFPLLIGSIKSNTKYVIYVRRIGNLVFLAIISGLCFLCFNSYLFYRRTSQHLNALFTQDDEKSNSFFDDHFSRLKLNHSFSNAYSFFLRENPDYDKMLQLAPTYELYCEIGDLLIEREEYDEARHYYQQASYMIPTRIRPNYSLWRLNVLQGNINESIMMAKKILSQPVKVENSYTIRVKTEIKKYLHGNAVF